MKFSVAEQSKECSKCHKILPFSEFNKDKRRKLGITSQCRACLNTDEKRILSRRKYVSKNLLKLKAKNKIYREKKKDVLYENWKIYSQKNKDKIYKTKKIWYDRKRKTDINFKLRITLRTRINDAVNAQRTNKLKRTEDLLGCSIDDFKNHIQNLFKEGMTWENHGIYGWHIDHIIPCSSFDLSKEEDQKKCFHFTNMQPLWWIDNLIKKDKIVI